MKTMIKFLMSVILIITLFVGISIVNNIKSDGSTVKRNVLSVNKVRANEVEKKHREVEEIILKLPEVENLQIEDKDLIINAKQLIKELRVLDVALIIDGEEKVKDLENKLVALSKIDVDTKDNIKDEKKQVVAESKSTVIEHKESVEPVNPRDPIITYKEVVDYHTIGFETSYVNDKNMTKGLSVVRTNGINGERKIVTKIKYADNKEVSRETVSNVVTKSPVNKVVVTGTKVEYIDTTGQTGGMHNEINKSRAEAGQGALVRSSRLDAAASIRVKEIVTNFSHTRPNGTLFNTVDPDVIFAENVAYGNSDPLITHGRFMASQGHKNNILNGAFKSVGLASYKPSSGPTYWVVLFSRY